VRNPEQILAYRSLREMVGSDPQQVWSVSPSDTLLTALRLMADKNIGFVVVLQGDALVGVLSERDCVRRMLTAANALDATQVSAIMVRDVVAVDYEHTFADCLRLMHEHRVRHLPVLRDGKVAAIISVRDLLAETVAHHRKVIGELERERLTIFTSMA
jgi:CBS domain-containing protein